MHHLYIYRQNFPPNQVIVQDRKPTPGNKQPSKNKQWQLRNKVGQEKDVTPRAETQMRHLVYILEQSEILNSSCD